MEACKPVSTPMQPRSKFTKDMMPDKEFENLAIAKIPYSNVVGSLMHATVRTHPDLGFLVGIVAQLISNPGMLHWIVVK